MKKKDEWAVEEMSVPREIVEMASERTKGILRHWGSGRWNTLEVLAVSLYLQGVADAARI